MSAPHTMTELLPRGNNRHTPVLRWTPIENPTGHAIGHLTIHNDRSSTEYRVDEFGADECRGFCFVKLTPGTDFSESHYCMTVSHDGAIGCECRGFVRWAKCKHQQALAAMIENGWL